MERSIEALVFDLDGTLVDSMHVVFEAFRHALATFQIEIGKDELEKIRSRSPGSVFSDWLNEEQALLAKVRLREYSRENVNRVKSFPGVGELLEELTDRGIPLAVWTGRDTTSAIEILESNQLHNHFSVILGGCQLERNKPDPEGLLRIARKHIQRHPSRLLMIGDHAHDVEGARRAEAWSGVALWGTELAQEAFSDHSPHYFFHSIEDLSQWVDQNLSTCRES